MSELAVFAFNTSAVRVVLKDGEPWFVAGDVAAVLGYRDAANMARNLDEDEKGTQIVSTLGGDQEVSVISESGLYAAVLKSRRPEARSFRKWVTADVLPSIRKTGGYQREAGGFAATTRNPSHLADLAVAADRTFRCYLRAARSAGLRLPAALRVANDRTVERTGIDMLGELGVDVEAMQAQRQAEESELDHRVRRWAETAGPGPWRMADLVAHFGVGAEKLGPSLRRNGIVLRFRGQKNARFRNWERV